MKELKRNIKFTFQVLKALFMVWMLVTCLLVSFFSIQQQWISTGENLVIMQEIQQLPVKMTMLMQVITGVFMIVFVFEIGIRICANRKSILYAIGGSSMLITIGAVLWMYVLKFLSISIFKQEIGRDTWRLHTEIDNINLGLLYLSLMLFGMLLASIYKKMGVMKSLLLGTLSIMMIGSSIWLNPEATLEWIINLVSIPGIGLVFAGIFYFISFLLLMNKALTGNSVQRG